MGTMSGQFTSEVTGQSLDVLSSFCTLIAARVFNSPGLHTLAQLDGRINSAYYVQSAFHKHFYVQNMTVTMWLPPVDHVLIVTDRYVCGFQTLPRE